MSLGPKATELGATPRPLPPTAAICWVHCSSPSELNTVTKPCGGFAAPTAALCEPVVAVLAVGLRLSVVEPVMATCEPSAETARPRPDALVGAPRLRV